MNLSACGKTYGSPRVLCTLESSFKNFYTYSHTADKITYLYDVGTDGGGNLFWAGFGVNAESKWYWLFGKSSDGGLNWEVKDTYQGVEYNAMARDILVDGTRVLVAGYYNDDEWLIRKSDDSGTSFSNVDTYTIASNKIGVATRIRKGNLGYYYAVGYMEDADNDYHMIIRRSTDGNSWSSVIDYSNGAGNSAYGYDVAVNSSGDLFAALMVSAGGSSAWNIRKLPAGQKTWEKVDNYSTGDSLNSAAYAIAIDKYDRIFAAGFADDNDGDDRLTVRKSTDNGKTWSVSLRSTDTIGNARDLMVDDEGYVYVVGFDRLSASAPSRSVAYKSTDGGVSWTKIDVYTNSVNASGDAVSLGAAIDNEGNIYTAGFHDDENGIAGGLLRRLLCSY